MAHEKTLHKNIIKTLKNVENVNKRNNRSLLATPKNQHRNTHKNAKRRQYNEMQAQYAEICKYYA